MTDAKLLQKHGWHVAKKQQCGCVKRVWWTKPGLPLMLPQGWLAIVLRQNGPRAAEKAAMGGGE